MENIENYGIDPVVTNGKTKLREAKSLVYSHIIRNQEVQLDLEPGSSWTSLSVFIIAIVNDFLGGDTACLWQPPSSRGRFWCIARHWVCELLSHSEFSWPSVSLVRITGPPPSWGSCHHVLPMYPLFLLCHWYIRVHWVPVLPAYHSDSRRATAFNQVSVAFLFCSISVVPLQSHLWLHCSQTNFPALSCFLCSALPFLHSPLLSTWYLPVHSSRLNVYIFFLENLLDFARLSVILL